METAQFNATTSTVVLAYIPKELRYVAMDKSDQAFEVSSVFLPSVFDESLPTQNTFVLIRGTAIGEGGKLLNYYREDNVLIRDIPLAISSGIMAHYHLSATQHGKAAERLLR